MYLQEFFSVLESIKDWDRKPCWIWKGPTEGYVRILYSKYDFIRSQRIFGHIISYEFTFGVIPEEMIPHHTCMNKSCINPYHIQIVTHSQHRMIHEGGSLTYCKRGHERTEENTYLRPDGRKNCKICHHENNLNRCKIVDPLHATKPS